MVALIVTIVVLLILVSITISTVVGDNGIITQAQQKEKELNQIQLNTELTRNELAAELEENKTGKGDGIVGFHPDGGNYVLPTGSNVAKVISEIQLANINSGFDIIEYAWSSSNTLAPTDSSTWTKAELVANTQTITNTQAAQGNNYLWVKITDATEGSTKTFVSSNFNVMNQDDVANKITVTPNKTNWTKDDVTVTINYGDNLPDNRKVGIGSANTDVEGNSTTITMTSNGTIYAEATDIAGNKVTINLEISNIDKTGPTVSLTRNSATTNSIKVTATATDAGSGVDTYTFYYKKTSESTYKQAQTGTSNTCTFTGLTQTTNYDIKVVVTDKVGNSTEKTLTSQATGTVPTASGNITFSSATWSSGKASVTMSTTTSYTIQYQIGSTTGTWTTGTKASNITTGSTVYARLWDGTNAGSYASLLVKDTVAPVLTVTPTSGTLARNRSVTVKITESESGIRSANTYEYWLSKSNTEPFSSHTAITTYTPGKAFTIGSEVSGTYYLYVRPVFDNQNNMSTASGGTIVKKSYDDGTTGTYNCFGPFVFDNTAPVITLTQTNTTTKEYTKTVSVSITENESSVSVKKYAVGSRNVSYFANNGKTLSGNSFTVQTSDSEVASGVAPTKTYTVYAKNSLGLESVKTITISNLLLNNTIKYNVLSARYGATGDSSTGVITLPVRVAGEYEYLPVQYGPYWDLEAGTYQITYTGTNLNKSRILQCYTIAALAQTEEDVDYPYTISTSTSTNIVYTVTLTESKPKVEFVIYNTSSSIMTVTNINIKQIK